jgi:hypothetical protein
VEVEVGLYVIEVRVEANMVLYVVEERVEADMVLFVGEEVSAEEADMILYVGEEEVVAAEHEDEGNCYNAQTPLPSSQYKPLREPTRLEAHRDH